MTAYSIMSREKSASLIGVRSSSALVDRLCHKSYLVNMTGTSYRIKETKKYISNK